MENVIIRLINQNEHNFVINSWLKSYRNHPNNLCISNDTYFAFQSELILACLKRAEVWVLEETTSNNLMGYIVVDTLAGVNLVHYYYIKYPFRKYGLLKLLFNHVGFNSDYIITSLPKEFHILKDKYNINYNPYLLFKGE